MQAIVAMGLVAVVVVMMAGAVGVVADDEARAYLRPGTPEVGGINDLCLIYHGTQRRVAWTKEALMPYVAHVDEAGKPQEWLFDSFLFIEFATDSGAWLHAYREDKGEATAADWAWLADCWFREQTGLIGMEQAVAEAGRLLGEPDHTASVVITMPKPMQEIKAFGPLEGQEKVLDFSEAENQHAAMAWYIERVLAQWQEHDYKHLKLAGFYWLSESIQPEEHDLVKWAAQYLHDRGQKLYWIPFYGARGVNDWQELGLDAVMLQPNYFFREETPLERLLGAAKRADRAGTGIEIEFDGRALSSETFRQRFYAYLDAGVKYGWMKGALLGYYEGGSAIKLFAESPGVGRELYEALCRFVKGTYEPSGTVGLAGLDFVSRNNSKNLALATKGAKIHGCIRPEGEPELAPEKIIDGDISFYGGMNGFGYFAWPGSFTIELAEAATVARTQTMLHDLAQQAFQYRIETSVDNENWEPAVDKSEGEWRGWQVDKFTPRKAKYVRFSGLRNSHNELFQVVEFEVYASQE